MKETSGHSPAALPPRGPNDNDHKTSPYFTGSSRFNKRNLRKWRVEEKELQRIMCEHAQPTHEAPNDFAECYNEFLQMINSLGLRNPEDNYDLDFENLPAQEDAGAKSSHLKSKCQADVFECLRKESHMGYVSSEASPEGSGRNARVKRVKSAPVKPFSIRKWQREFTDKYVKSVIRPRSGHTTEEVDKTDQDNISKTGPNRPTNVRLRPSSAPVRRKLNNKLPPTPEYVEEPASNLEEKSELKNNRRLSLPAERSYGRRHYTLPNNKFAYYDGTCNMRGRGHTADADKVENGNCGYRDWLKDGIEEARKMGGNLEKGQKIKSAKQKISSQILKQKPPKIPSKGRTSEHHGQRSHIRKTEKAQEAAEADDNLFLKGKPSEKIRKGNESAYLETTYNNLDFQLESVKGENTATEDVEEAETESHCDVEDNDDVNVKDDFVSRWKRDLAAEAPPSVFSRRTPIKIQLALSKLERQRELGQMVRDNSFPGESLVTREKIRQARQRLKVVATIQKVVAAASEVKETSEKPSTDHDLLRDINDL